MNHSIHRISALFLAASTLIVPLALAEETGGPAGSLATRTVNTIPTADGAVQITIPPGWEINTRLAEDYVVFAFLHPSGPKLGDEIPVWLIVDRCQRYLAEDFEKLLKRVLLQGAEQGYVLRESASIPTADGRLVTNCAFEPTEDGTERGLALLPSASGAITFRYQCASAEEWKARRPEIEGVLRGLRFFPMQATKEAPAPEK
ncbi:MAG: hypothetical protein FJY88_02310 [Candidatus Eisenbacteria bacterium]|nr:hypothetical protein [Candidatus Eisenbacteria bacterium]